MSGPLRLRFGGYQGPASVHTRAMEAFARALHDIAGDAVTVDLHRDVTGQGHKLTDLLEMTEGGEFDACYTSSSYLAGRVPSLGLFDLAFAVPDRDTAFALLDGPLGTRLAEDVAERTGFAMLGLWDNGLRHFSTVDRVLARPEDCAGLRLRTLVNADHQRVFGALGFDARIVDIRDLPGAVASGEIEAQENPLTNTYRFDLHRTHRVVTLTGHLQGIAPVLFNRARLQSLPDGIRAAVMQAMDRASREQRAMARDEDTHCAAALVAHGVRMVPLSEAGRAAFRAAVAPALAESRARLDPELLTIFEAVQPARTEAQP